MRTRQSLVEKRVTLLRTCSKKNLSYDTRLQISQHIAKYKKVNEEAEAEAEKITAIINSSKTEEEILEKLSELEK